MDILLRNTIKCEYEDLKQEAFLALYDAVKNYDESKGAKFSTYVSYWMKNRISRYICGCTKGIKIQEKAEYTRRKYIKFISEYEMEHGEKPEADKICRYLRVDIETIDRIEKIQRMATIYSSDSPIDVENKNGISIIDTIAAPNKEDTIIEKIDNERILCSVWGIVEKMPEQEKAVIFYRYKLDMEQNEVADKMQIDVKEVIRIHSMAIRKLRNNQHIRELAKYYSDTDRDYYIKIGVSSYNTTWNSATEKAALRI